MPKPTQQSNSVLGKMPINQGIFSQTTHPDIQASAIAAPAAPTPTSTEKRKKKKEEAVLSSGETIGLNLRIPKKLNMIFENVISFRRNNNKRRITKERMLQGAMELLLATGIDLKNINDESDLKEYLTQVIEHLKTFEYRDDDDDEE